jgi:localization factor PodJL
VTTDKQRSDKPWSVRGVDHDARSAATMAAQRAGLPIGAWLSRTILEAAAKELTVKAVGPTLEATVQQLVEAVAQSNQTTQAIAARLETLESTQTAPRGILWLFRRRSSV